MSRINDKPKEPLEIQTDVDKDKFDLKASRPTTFAQRLKLVIGHGSMTAFAQRCNLSESAIRKYIRGDSEPTLPNLLIISKVGNVPLSWLATGETEIGIAGGFQAKESRTFPPFVANPEHLIVNEIDFNSLLNTHLNIIPNSHWSLNKKWLNKEGLQHANLAFTSLNCENMGQITKYGDIALINIKQAGWQGALEGIFIISLNNDLFVKRVQFDLIRNGYHLCSDHSFYRDHFVEIENFPNFKIIAKIERILMPIL